MRAEILSKTDVLHPTGLISNRKGFTLIELTIVLVIVGIIISIMASVLPSLIASSKIRQNQALLEKADNALQGYCIANRRLPFADNTGDGIEDSSTLVFVGNLPYRTLGLSSGDDIWGNPIHYAVYGVAGSANNLTDTNAGTFCTVINNAITALFDSSIVHTTDASPCSPVSSATASNQAYVLASGGLKNMDGVNGYFDNCNGQAGAGFNIPGKIQDTTYDDQVRALSLTELNQKICSGSGSGTTGTNESTVTGGCSNTIDDDGDSLIDCADPDCGSDPACSGPSALDITTTSIPNGILNSSYMTTFAASGGTTPYSWSLINNGGFSDFSINSSTGTLTGTLDQCPSPPDYTISVQVQDSTLPADGGPFTDSDSFTLQVTKDLTVSRTSGSGTSITWDGTAQQETFATAGAHMDTIDWSLNTDGATGFTVISTGDTTCRIQKSGTTAIGTYTFVLTATDAACSNNTADLTLSVTVTASGAGPPGNLTGVVDSLEFYPANMSDPDIIHTSGDYYAIAFTGNSNDGALRTVAIDAGGTISAGSYTQFDWNTGHTPDIIHINGDIYAVAFEGPNGDGWIRAMNIDSSGTAWPTWDSLEFETSEGEQTKIVHVTGDIYAIVYRGRTGNSNDGWIDTVTIQASGAMSGPLNRYEFDNSQGEEASIVQVAGEIFAIAYRGPDDDGWVKTVSIDSSGTISGTGQALEFDGTEGREPVIVKVSTDIYAIAYRGPSDDGWIKTVSIDSTGTITGPVASFEFDTVHCQEPDMIHLSGDVFAVAYEGPDGDGWIKTVTIDSAGLITATGSSLEFDTNAGTEPSLVKISDTMIAVAYSGPGSDGYIKTISVE